MSQYEDQELESELNKLFDTDEETRKLFEEIESIKEDAAKTAAQSTEQAPAKEQVAEDLVSQEPTPEPVEETTPVAEEPAPVEPVEEEVKQTKSIKKPAKEEVYDPPIEPGHFVMLYRRVFGNENEMGGPIFGPYDPKFPGKYGGKEESKIVNRAMRSSKTFQEALANIKEDAKSLKKDTAKKAPAKKAEAPKEKSSGVNRKRY